MFFRLAALSLPVTLLLFLTSGCNPSKPSLDYNVQVAEQGVAATTIDVGAIGPYPTLAHADGVERGCPIESWQPKRLEQIFEVAKSAPVVLVGSIATSDGKTAPGFVRVVWLQDGKVKSQKSITSTSLTAKGQTKVEFACRGQAPDAPGEYKVEIRGNTMFLLAELPRVLVRQ